MGRYLDILDNASFAPLSTTTLSNTSIDISIYLDKSADKGVSEQREYTDCEISEISETRAPTHPCYLCGQDRYWQRPDGGWVCGICHPVYVRSGEDRE